MIWKPQFTPDEVLIVDDQQSYSGYSTVRQLSIQYPLFQGGMSVPIFREVVFRPNAVAVLLYDPDRCKVVMIEQFRAPALFEKENPWLLEIVAGLVEEAENPEETATREVWEETGCKILSLISIGAYLTTPGTLAEKIFLYCGRIHAPDNGGIQGIAEEGENIKVHVISRDDIFQLLADGGIISSPALIAIQWLKLNYASLHFPLHAE